VRTIEELGELLEKLTGKAEANQQPSRETGRFND